MESRDILNNWECLVLQIAYVCVIPIIIDIILKKRVLNMNILRNE